MGCIFLSVLIKQFCKKFVRSYTIKFRSNHLIRSYNTKKLPSYQILNDKFSAYTNLYRGRSDNMFFVMLTRQFIISYKKKTQFCQNFYRVRSDKILTKNIYLVRSHKVLHDKNF